jgi:hypothetical protein
MAQSNGGISQSSRISAYPMVNVSTGQAGLYAFDPSLGFNDQSNPSNYFYKMEEIVPGKTPTVSKLIVSYRDLGLVAVTFTLTGTNDLQQVVSATTGSVILGNLVPTSRIMTRNDIGLTLTAQNLQLSWTRAAGAGSLSIVKIIMTGTVEAS